MSELITFDKIFDNNDVRKSIYVKEDNTSEDPTMYDPTKNEATQIPEDKKEMINKKIMDLFVGSDTSNIKLEKAPSGISKTNKLGEMKGSELDDFISIFYSFPFSNSKIEPSLPGASLSETIKSFPKKTDTNSKVIYFANNDAKGKLATIKNYNKDNIQILIDDSAINKVKDNQLFFLERTNGTKNKFLDEDVYKNYIKYNGKKILVLLNDLVSSIKLKDNKMKYIDFVQNTSFKNKTVGNEDIPSEYQTNKFRELLKLNKSADTDTNNSSTGSSDDSPTGSPNGSPTSTSASTSTNKQINCEITNAAASGGKKKRKTMRKKTNKRKRKTIKKRKTKKPKKSMKRRKTKRVTFKL
tara:strand:+ start:4968 stop:6032 length:1065 start_codon:yes stop_codon:yes gene_type:complete